MKFGRMDRRVRFKKPSTAQNPYGDVVPGWSNISTEDMSLGEVWAEVLYPGSPKETPQAHQIFPERQITFIVRHPRDSFIIGDRYRVRYEGEEYEIIGQVEIGRKDGLRIFCRRVQDGL